MSPSLPPEATPRTGPGPKPGVEDRAPDAAVNGTEGSMEPYDALADLFLGDGPGGGGSRPQGERVPGAARADGMTTGGLPRTSGVVIEGLILGHLPVLASVWATQYARHVSEQTGEPVALVRVREDQTTIELFGGASTREMTPGTIEQAVAAARSAARIWLVRADEMTEPRLAELDGIDAVTLLTGADDAAVVASYRTVKSLHEQRASAGDGQGPEVRVAIMGSGGAKAEDAACKLSRAAGTFLGTKLKVSVCAPKIGAGKSAAVYKGDTAGRPDEMLERLSAAIRSTGGAAATGRVESPRAAGPLPSADMIHAPQHVYAPLNGRAPMPEPAARVAGAARPLAQHVSPTLRALPVVCPFAPALELAADDDGTIHVLAECAEGVSESHALESLMGVASWAAEHAAVLQFAVPASADGAKGPVLAAGRPVMHLLTDSPRNVRRLLDAELRVHLLTQVSMGDRTAWVCKALN